MQKSIISVDTETANDIPFIATSTNSKLESTLFEAEIDEDYEKLKDLCENDDIVKVFHNAVFDVRCLENIGIDVSLPYEDTMIMATLLNENYDSKALKSLAKVYLNEKCEEDTELKKVIKSFKKSFKEEDEDFTYKDIPADILHPYAIKDAEYTIKLYYLFKTPIYEKYEKIYKLELQLVPIIIDMIRHGFNIDREFVKNIIKTYEKEIDEVYAHMCNLLFENNIQLLKKIERKSEQCVINNIDKLGYFIENIKYDKIKDKFVGTYEEPFSPTSTYHLRFILISLNLETSKTTEKTGLMSTDLDSLKKLKGMHPFIDYLIRWRFLFKQISTYYRPLLEKYTSEEDTAAHFSYHQSGAKSGRFTAELIQTIPRKDDIDDERYIRHVRKAFIPFTNNYLVAIDYEQIEFRLFAHFSNCISLINDINVGLDGHTSTAYTLFGKDEVEKDATTKKKLRRIAKTINFGLIYGMGQKALAANLGLPFVEAFNIIEDYHKKFPVKQYTRDLASILYRQGYVTLEVSSSLMDFTRDYRVPQELSYRAVNILIQGCASYVMKYGMLRCYNWIKESKQPIKLISTIHDELIFNVDKSIYNTEVVKKLAELMEDRVSFKIPILASAKVSDKSWGDAVELKL